MLYKIRPDKHPLLLPGCAAFLTVLKQHVGTREGAVGGARNRGMGAGPVITNQRSLYRSHLHTGRPPNINNDIYSSMHSAYRLDSKVMLESSLLGDSSVYMLACSIFYLVVN